MGWVACEEQLPFGPAVQLFYKLRDSEMAVGCGDVDLVAEHVV